MVDSSKENPGERMVKAKEAYKREPFVRILEFRAQREGDFEEIASLFSPSTMEISFNEDEIYLLNVRSRDINKNPYVFTRITLREKTIELAFSIVPEIPEEKREAEAAIELLNVLAILENRFRINEKDFFSFASTLLEKTQTLTSEKYDEVYAKYEAVLEEYAKQQKKIEETNTKIEEVSKANMMLKEKNDELVLRLRELEKYSDETLMLKIQEWLREHGNEINIGHFSKVNEVSETRVEEMLDKMIKEGYLE